MFRGDRDREIFANLLASVVSGRGWLCHAFCLLGTHYHLLVETPQGDVAAGMHRLNGVYAQGFNRRHGRKGHLLEDRYYSVVIEADGHLLQVIRYIALNPVHAGVCARPADWQWSSYAWHFGRSPVRSFLASERLLGLFGADPEVARERLRAFVEESFQGPGATRATNAQRGQTPHRNP